MSLHNNQVIALPGWFIRVVLLNVLELIQNRIRINILLGDSPPTPTLGCVFRKKNLLHLVFPKCTRAHILCQLSKSLESHPRGITAPQVLECWALTCTLSPRSSHTEQGWGEACGGRWAACGGHWAAGAEAATPSPINTTGLQAQPLMSVWASVTVNPKSYLECSLQIRRSEIKGQVPNTKKDEILLTHWTRDRGGGRKDILIRKLDSTTAKMERGKPDLSWLFLDTGFYEIQIWDC